MQHLTPMIIERVNRFFGYAAVDKIAFRQGRVRRAPSAPVRPRRAPVPRELGEGLREIADPELRACLESLAAKLVGIGRRARRRPPTPFPFPPLRSNLMTHSSRLALAAPPSLVTAACNADKGSRQRRAASTGVAATPVAAPNNGDWSTVVSQTPEGGFVMGNPNAKVKLVEFGSMTCPHCAEFDEKGAQAADRQLCQEAAGVASNSATSSATPMTSPPRWSRAAAGRRASSA